MSGLINILYLTGSFYMLEVYDRVLPSRSVPTLVALSILAVTLFAFQGVLDVIRSRVMVRIAATLDERLSGRIYVIVVQLPLRTRGQGDGLAPMRDLDQVRSFLASSGPLALFDLPWMPIYLIICFLFHPWIGVAALVGAIILTSMTLMSEFMTRGPSRIASTQAGARNRMTIAAIAPAPPTGRNWRNVVLIIVSAIARCSRRARTTASAPIRQAQMTASSIHCTNISTGVVEGSSLAVWTAPSARASSPVVAATAGVKPWKRVLAASWARIRSISDRAVSTLRILNDMIRR